jgi:hypothetical protein
MKGVSQPDLARHGFDQSAGSVEQFRGLIHFQPQQVLVRALVMVALE